MAGAWWSYEEARRRGVAVGEIDLIKEILRYNQGDCSALLSVLRCLRRSR
jgi:hypothetical protein